MIFSFKISVKVVNIKIMYILIFSNVISLKNNIYSKYLEEYNVKVLYFKFHVLHLDKAHAMKGKIGVSNFPAFCKVLGKFLQSHTKSKKD